MRDDGVRFRKLRWAVVVRREILPQARVNPHSVKTT
jgi:hypothetical protein